MVACTDCTETKTHAGFRFQIATNQWIHDSELIVMWDIILIHDDTIMKKEIIFYNFMQTISSNIYAVIKSYIEWHSNFPHELFLIIIESV